MKIRKIISVALVFITALFLWGCQQNKQTVEYSSDTKLPELKIGVKTLRPFFYMDENGDWDGIDEEIAVEACRRAGYSPNFIMINWDDKDQALEDGTVDCLWTAFIKNGKEDFYLWTDTYLQSNIRVITIDKDCDKDLSALNGKEGIAVQADSKEEELLLENPEVSKVYSCRTFEMAETAFVKNYTRALCGQELVLQQTIDAYSGLYNFIDGSLMAADLGVAFRNGDDSEQWKQINTVLNDMKDDGTISEIFEKYSLDTADAKEASVNAQNK